MSDGALLSGPAPVQQGFEKHALDGESADIDCACRLHIHLRVSKDTSSGG